MTIQARLYLDTICSHSWNARPNIARLREEYRDRLEFDYVCYPLIGPDASGVLDRRRRRFLSTHWAEVSEYGGEPIAHRLWLENAPNGSFLAGEAYLAARRQGIPEAHRFLERVQLSVMAQRGRISDPELLYELADQVDLDPERLMADLDAVRSSGEMSALMEIARAKGVRSRPTLVLSNRFGQEYWVIGPQPYEEFRRGVESLLASTGGSGEILAKIGGRIIGFSDFEVRAARVTPRGIDFEAGFSGGQPGAPKQEGAVAVRFLRVQGTGWLSPDLMARLWELKLGLVTVFGRLSGPPAQTVRLIGVRALSSGTGVAPSVQAAAEQGLGLLKPALEASGLRTAPAEPEHLEWITELPGRAVRPALMQFIPGWPVSGDPLLALPGDFALVAALEPASPGTVAAKREALLEAAGDYRRRLTVNAGLPQAAALAESILMREEHASRWDPAQGMWRTLAYLLASPGGGREPDQNEIASALESLYRDPTLPSPVAVNPLHLDTLDHIAEHIRSFTLCDERWLHGADWWNTWLTGEEAVRYFPPSG